MGKKQPKKRAWRKADISDVEEAIEDERLVAKLKKQADQGQRKSSNETEELFTIDTSGSFDGVSAKSRRELARAKLFPPKGPNIGMTASEEGKIARAEQRLDVRRTNKKADETFDLWAAPTAAEVTKKALEDEQVGGFNIRRNPKHVPLSIPKTLHQKVSAAPAVIPAHEGQSVNPESEAFEDLACMAAARQLEHEREVELFEQRLQPITAALRSHGVEGLDQMDDETKLKTYRSLILDSDAQQREGESDEVFQRRLAKMKLKSQAQRNKQRKQRVLNTKQARLKAQQKLDKSVGEVGAILKDIKQKEEEREERKKYREALRAKQKELEMTEGKVPSTRRLGKIKFSEQDIAVPTAEALGSGLRGMPLKASAVKDRLSSILRRGLLPALPDANQRHENFHRKKIKVRRKFKSPLLREKALLR